MANVVIKQVIGSVVDIQFPAGNLPNIYDAVRIEDGKLNIVLEVMQHLGNDAVRCIALSSTDGLARGMAVENTGSPLTMPVGKETLGRMFNVTGDVIDGGAPLSGEQRLPCLLYTSRCV